MVDVKVERLRQSEPRMAREENSVADMIEELELFSELTEDDRAWLEKSATSITFLPGDTIMGAYQSGDTFYILIVGDAEVWRTDALSYPHHVADLTDGDIIGESALLAELERGRHIRSATIKAISACILLRISMRSMLRLLEKYPAIRDRIQQIHDARGADQAPKITDD